ncbi:MAG: hypothetical protein R3E31_30255 [Chloroflexota bacterium]
MDATAGIAGGNARRGGGQRPCPLLQTVEVNGVTLNEAAPAWASRWKQATRMAMGWFGCWSAPIEGDCDHGNKSSRLFVVGLLAVASLTLAQGEQLYPGPQVDSGWEWWHGGATDASNPPSASQTRGRWETAGSTPHRLLGWSQPI